jgi:hypothetical protein
VFRCRHVRFRVEGRGKRREGKGSGGIGKEGEGRGRGRGRAERNLTKYKFHFVLKVVRRRLRDYRTFLLLSNSHAHAHGKVQYSHGIHGPLFLGDLGCDPWELATRLYLPQSEMRAGRALPACLRRNAWSRFASRCICIMYHGRVARACVPAFK